MALTVPCCSTCYPGLLLHRSKQALCVFASKPFSAHEQGITLYMKLKAFSCHLSTCDMHFCPVLCEEARESLILYCCQHLSLAQICHIAEVSLSLL